jgi:hypothetical protein
MNIDTKGTLDKGTMVDGIRDELKMHNDSVATSLKLRNYCPM